VTDLGGMLDRTLSLREHLAKTAGKPKNRNNLLMKVAGTSWGANAETLCDHLRWLYAMQLQSTVPLFGPAQLTQVWSMYS